MDDIRNCEHPSKHRFLAVPEGGRNDAWERKVSLFLEIGCVPTIEEEALESFLDLQL
jgi:hypothetical protein